MTTRVLYTPDDRELDLDRLSDADHDLITSLHDLIGPDDRVLRCLAAAEEHDALYVHRVADKYFLAHFAAGGHAPHPVVRIGDEHKRQTEYWYRAGEDAGYPSDTGYATGGRVVDVAIHGPRRTAVEVQRSRITVRTARRRTTGSHRAGWSSLWFTAADRVPSWFHHVPSVGCNHLPWDDLPPRGRATATGLRRVTVARCDVHSFDRCPAGHRRHCGDDHAKLEVWRGLTLDRVAGLVPSGQVVPLRTPDGLVYFVPQEDVRVYRDLTGYAADYRPEDEPVPARECVTCGNPLFWLRPGRTRCERCDPVMRR
ncbi:hypothetical protein GCM10022243_34190 [Saccharothrix violaceirubra]|uniref:Uncharacterized protein n=1 Tax=Saccharothrix violaceirubra TaxID=413306 RepID=A0A7W7T4P9_9PSEU|nr:hypothetical protein [Saccharothrix violaceirubra]MBB4966472.1 hypothetical protein [Saccharothrix violaceirubra]